MEFHKLTPEEDAMLRIEDLRNRVLKPMASLVNDGYGCRFDGDSEIFQSEHVIITIPKSSVKWRTPPPPPSEYAGMIFDYIDRPMEALLNDGYGCDFDETLTLTGMHELF